MACQTAGGQQFQAAWFVDASGQRRLFAKAFGIPKDSFGRRKVCLWTYFKTEPHGKGTSFYSDVSDRYLRWVWEIPITPEEASVGYILPAEQMKAHRRNGKKTTEILRDELAKHARFTQLLAEQPDTQVSTCSYQSYVHRQVCGPNWLMVGESASFLDPLTSNGVTSALRHARYAVDFVKDSLERGTLSKRQRRVYTANVRWLGRAYNGNIETAVYSWPIRWGLGIIPAVTIYSYFGYTMNALYTYFRPRDRLAMTVFGLLFAGARVWIGSWALIGRLAYRARRLWAWARRLWAWARHPGGARLITAGS